MDHPAALPGIEISTDREDLICYSFDSSSARATAPRAVTWPRNTDEVVRIVRYAGEKGLSIVTRGAGTGMAGASVPQGDASIVVSLEKMKKFLEISTKNLSVVVEPGMINGKLQKELEFLGYFYPPDPASLDICTIGGNVATNAGGPRALKYGVTRDYVMAMEAVLPDGTVINVGGKTYKRAVGYDLKDLIVGSEGTLAIVTKIRLRILPMPEDVVTLMVLFDDLESTGAAVSKIISSKIIPRTMELLDRSSIEAIEQYKPTGLPADVEALLLIELDGHPATIRKEADRVVAICGSYRGESVIAEDGAARERLWEARRSVSPALFHLKPDKINEDIVVPRDKIPVMLRDLRRLSEESGIRIVSFGHAGDGNLHVNIMVDRRNGDEYARGKELVGRIFEATLNLGGSLSGEHGIGLLKRPYFDMEVRGRELEIMKGIKQVFDPRGILNPGKIFP